MISQKLSLIPPPPIEDVTLFSRYVLLPGKDHYDGFDNRQDQLAIHWHVNSDNGLVEASAVTCDGCSSSPTSEAGAALLSQFAAPVLAQLVNQHGYHQYQRVLTVLYGSIIGYVRNQIEQFPNGKEYLSLLELEKSGGVPFNLDDHPHLKPVYYWIDRNFMVTMVGCYFGVDATITFQRGDGGHFVDGTFHTESFEDFPPYIAYAMLPRQKMEESMIAINEQRQLAGKDPLPQVHVPAFTGHLYPRASYAAIFSDGLTHNGKPMTGVLNNEIWERLDHPHLWENRKNRLRNWIRQSWKDGTLKDDVSLIAFRREITPLT